MSVYLLAIIVFFVDLVVAFAWAKCVKSVSDDKALESGLWSIFITLSGAITIISYTQNHLLLIPATLGGGVGTYLSVKYKKKW